LTLTPSSGSLVPSFSRTTTSYTLSVGGSISCVKFKAVTVDVGATVTVNGNALTSSVALGVGVTEITIVGRAENPSFTTTYTITVTRGAFQVPSGQYEGQLVELPFRVSKGYVAAPACAVQYTNAFTYLFWIQPRSTVAGWGSVLRKGYYNISYSFNFITFFF